MTVWYRNGRSAFGHLGFAVSVAMAVALCGTLAIADDATTDEAVAEAAEVAPAEDAADAEEPAESDSDAANDETASAAPNSESAAHDGAHHDGDHHDGDHHGDHGHHDLGHGDASPSLTDPSSLAKDLAIYTFVVFLGLLAILSKFAWPTISEALEAREKRIEQHIADAETQLEKAKALVAEHDAKLAGAADEVRELLEEARRDADATIAQAKADAKAEFEAERQRAARDVEQARDAAVRDLAERTAGLAIDLAGRVVQQEISPDRQSQIVQEALGRFSADGTSLN